MAAVKPAPFNPVATVNHSRNDVRLSINSIAKGHGVKAASIHDLHNWLSSTLTEQGKMTSFGKDWKPHPGETRAGVLDQAQLKKALSKLNKMLSKVADEGFGTTASGKDRTPLTQAELKKWMDNELVTAIKGSLQVTAAKGGKTRPATAAEIRQWMN